MAAGALLAGPLASALALFAVWRLGCAMLGQQRALLAVLAQQGVLYFTIFTPEFNHNVVLLPLWAALGLAGYRACFEPGTGPVRRWMVRRAGRARAAGQVHHALFLLPLLLLAVLHPRLRRVWAAPVPGSPWPSCCCCFCRTARPVADRLRAAVVSVRARARPGALVRPHRQSVAIRRRAIRRFAAALLALALLAWRRRGKCWLPRPARCRRTYAPTCGPSPGRRRAALAASVVLGLHLKDMWGYPMWCFIGLFLMAEVVGPFTARGLQRFSIAWLVILVTVPIVFTVQNTIGGGSCASRCARRSPARSWRTWWNSAGTRPSARHAGDRGG